MMTLQRYFTITAVSQANMDQIEKFLCLQPSFFICPSGEIIYSAKVEKQLWFIGEGTLKTLKIRQYILHSEKL